MKLTQTQIDNERDRRSGSFKAARLIEGVRRGVYIPEPATKEAIKNLMLASHQGRCGELSPPEGGDFDF